MAACSFQPTLMAPEVAPPPAEEETATPHERCITRLKKDERFKAEAYDHLKMLAGELPEVDKTLSLDLTLHRFLVAKESKPLEAFDQLKRVLAWQKETLPSPPRCVMCETRPASHSFVPLGWETSESSPIIYGCPARASNSDVDPTVLHVASQLEYCFAHEASGSRWVWLVDYNGFGFSHAMQGSLAIKFATLFSQQMPERLHKILLINAPTIFRMLLSVVSPFVDTRTMDKIVSISGTAQQISPLLRTEHHFPEPVIAWFEATLAADPKPGSLPTLPASAHSMLLSGLHQHYDFHPIPVPAL
jgi:hypothetical protein